MKRIINLFLFIFFANLFFADAFAEPIKTKINFDITDNTISNLKKSAIFFTNEVDKFCKEITELKLEKPEICKDNAIENTKNLQKITTNNAKKDTKNFLETIVGFYKELKDLSKSQEEKNKILSTKQADEISRLKADIAKKQNELKGKLQTLAKTLDEERDALENLSDGQYEKICKDGDCSNITKISSTQIITTNSKLGASGYKGTQQHSPNDISIPNYDDINNETDKETLIQKLKELNTKLNETSNAIDKEQTTTNKNIDALKKIKEEKDIKDEQDKEIEKRLNELLKLKQDQANILKDLGKNVTITKGNDRTENTNLDTSFPSEAKGLTYNNKSYNKPNQVNTKQNKNNPYENIIANLDKEIEQAEINKGILNAYKDKKDKEDKDALKDCIENLNKIIDPNKAKQGISLQECREQLAQEQRNQEEQIEKIKDMFEELKKLIQDITDREIIIFDKSDIMANYVKGEISLSWHETEIKKKYNKAQNMKGYRPLGYSNDGDNPKITYNTKIGNEIGETTKLGELTYNEMESKSLATLKKWSNYVGKLIDIAKANITIMNEFITQETSICANGHDNTKLQTKSDNYKLYTAVENCLQNQQKQICIEFKNTIKNTDIIKELKEKAYTSETTSCIKEMNEKNCNEYKKLKGINEINISISSTINDTTYLNECKKLVDNSVIDKAKNSIKYNCNPAFTAEEKQKYENMWTDKIKTNKNYTEVVNQINNTINEDCIQKQIKLAKTNCGKIIISQPKQTENPLKNYQTNTYNSVQDVINDCKEGLNNICSDDWNNIDITQTQNMKNKLKICLENKDIEDCNKHKNDGSKLVNITLPENTTINKTPPSCYKDSDIKICNEYAKTKRINPENIQITYNDIERIDDYQNINNCTQSIDAEKSRLNKIQNAINSCPELKNIDASKFNTEEEVRAECLKRQINNAVKQCNDNAGEKLIDEYNGTNYSSIDDVKTKCFDKFKKQCNDSEYENNSRYNWSGITFENMKDKLKECLNNIKSLQQIAKQAEMNELKGKIFNMAKDYSCKANKLAETTKSEDVRSGANPYTEVTNYDTKQNDYKNFWKKKYEVEGTNTNIDDLLQSIKKYCELSGGNDPELEGGFTKKCEYTNSDGNQKLTNSLRILVYNSLKGKCNKPNPTISNNYPKGMCRYVTQFYEGCL